MRKEKIKWTGSNRSPWAAQARLSQKAMVVLGPVALTPPETSIALGHSGANSRFAMKVFSVNFQVWDPLFHWGHWAFEGPPLGHVPGSALCGAIVLSHACMHNEHS